jgi:hypothetical protein
MEAAAERPVSMVQSLELGKRDCGSNLSVCNRDQSKPDSDSLACLREAG